MELAGEQPSRPENARGALEQATVHVEAVGAPVEREARLADGTERGRVPVDVLVCCEAAREAEATCRAVERDLRRDSWTGAGEGWHMFFFSRGLAWHRPRHGVKRSSGSSRSRARKVKS